jgi:drug/metabolite transporter (DMT)-like permease
MKKSSSYLLCFIAISLFSTYEIVGKLVGHHIPAVSMTAIRFLIGGILLLPMALREKKEGFIFTGKVARKILLVGVLNVSISMVLLQLSVFYGKAVLAAIIFSANPVFVGIFSLIFEKEKLSKLNIIGLATGLLGLVMIAIAEKSLFAGSGNMVLGVIFGVSSGMVFGAYTVLSKIYVNEIGTFKLNSYAFISGALILLLVSSILGIDMKFNLTQGNLLSLAYLGIIITGIGYFIYFEGLKNIATSKGAMFFYLKPVIAGILAFFILDETLTIGQIFGFLIVFLGVNLERIYVFLQNKVGN